MKENKKIRAQVDYPLLLIVTALVMWGSVMIFSSSVIMAEFRWQQPYLFVIKQAIWVIFGAIAMLFMANFDYRRFQEISRPLILLAIVLLVTVLLFGAERGGAKRWLRWGPISFQPSEFAKLAVVISIADYLDRRRSRINSWQGLLPPIILTGILSLLIALEPDLGTPVILFCVGISLLFIAGARVGHLAMVGISILPLIIFEVLRKPYRIERIKIFLNSWWGVNPADYQIEQSILAFGSGGFIGKGLAQSQTKMLYLPEPHTDFIFPIIGEELGFVGVAALIMLFILFAWRGWVIGQESKDYFGRVLAIGITLLISYQALLNMGVTCGLLPTKGLPLPFVSFGGTSLLFSMASVGILLNISRNAK